MTNQPGTNPAQAPKKGNAFWPSVDTLEGAREACRQGAWAAVIVAALTGGIALLSMAGVTWFASLKVDAWSLIDAGVFAVVAWGLFQCSRVAAVAGLLLFLGERAIAIAAGQTGGIPLAVVLAAFFVGGVRGAFAHRRLSRAASEAGGG
jgi:hypothetical protein